MYSDVAQFVRDSRELDTLLAEIESLKKAIFDSAKGGLDAVLSSGVRGSVAAILREKFKAVSPEKYLEGLENELKNLKEIKLTLSFEPPEELMENIYSWVATNIGPGIIVRMEFDPKILGGAVIAYGGKYFDGSLYKIVESKLQSSKESIIDKIVNFK